MRSLVDEVKDRLDIVEVVAGYVKMTSAGTNMRGICPFHREKTPSFMVSREKQIFHCFGCGKGGDVITFIQEIEGMEFKEALRLLAERTGLDYRSYQGTAGKSEAPDNKEALRRVLETTAAYYQKNMESAEGETARKYLLERGLTRESISAFQLGYAPRVNFRTAPSALYDYLRSIGYATEAIMASGSVYKKEGKEVYVDRFRERVIFPVADSLGRVAGFSARLLPGSDSSQGKYINTPGTLLYDKGNLLYGFHLAKAAIRENGEAIMLEGNLDVILSHQAGIRQAVATCGTALGKKQLTFLRRYTQKLVLAFDADMAGVKATKRAADLAWEEDFDVKVIPIKAGKDVADIVKENSPKWLRMVSKKCSVAGYFFNLAFKNRILDLDQKKVLADKILKLLARIPSRVEQSYYLKHLAEEVQVPEALLWEKMSKTYSGVRTVSRTADVATKPQKPSVTKEKRDRKYLLEERLIGLVYNFPRLYFKYGNSFGKCVFFHSETGHLWQELKNLLDSLPREDRNKIKSADLKFGSRDLALKISEIALTVEKELGEDPDERAEKVEDELKACLFASEREFLKDQRAKMLQEIKKVHEGGNKDEINGLMKRLQDVSREIAT